MTPSSDDATVSELLAITAVVLLVNPAHASALNLRKNLIENGVTSETDELSITSALQLTSDGSKSSILWHHRRWILRRLYASPSSNMEEIPFDSLAGCKLPMDVVLAEFAAVATAGEIYPRNYHAWRHRYICLQGAVSSRHAHPEQQNALAQLLRAEEFGLKKWTELHATDYTAMQYLCQLYAAMDACGIQHIQIHEGLGDDSDQSEREKVEFSLLGHFIELVTRYPSHEALWYALWSAYALLPSKRAELESMKGLDDANLQKFERWRDRFDCE